MKNAFLDRVELDGRKGDYLKRTLKKDENIVGKAKITWCTLIVPIVFFALCILGAITDNGVNSSLIVIGVIPLIYMIIRNKVTYLVITDKRVLGKIGVFLKKTWDFPINKIDNIAQTETIAGSFFGYATLGIYGCSGKGIVLSGIRNAEELKNTLVTAIDLCAEEEHKKLATEIAQALTKTECNNVDQEIALATDE